MALTGPGIESGRRRASGKAAAEEEADKGAEEMTAPVEEEVVDIERMISFQSTALSRMRTDWDGENKMAVDRITKAVKDVIVDTFPDAYLVIEDIYMLVRTPVTTEDGEVVTDRWGLTEWVVGENGLPVEDWTALTSREREDFLLRLTTNLFDWEQRAADLWTQAMFAKALWTESFSHYFDEPMRGTVDDRTAKGNVKSAEERYFALYLSSVSRKADALVKSMDRLTLRLRDTMG